MGPAGLARSSSASSQSASICCAEVASAAAMELRPTRFMLPALRLAEVGARVCLLNRGAVLLVFSFCAPSIDYEFKCNYLLITLCDMQFALLVSLQFCRPYSSEILPVRQVSFSCFGCILPLRRMSVWYGAHGCRFVLGFLMQFFSGSVACMLSQVPHSLLYA